MFMLAFWYLSSDYCCTLEHKEQPILKVKSSYKIYKFYLKVRFKIITYNYVIIMFLYLTFNGYNFPEEIFIIKC